MPERGSGIALGEGVGVPDGVLVTLAVALGVFDIDGVTLDDNDTDGVTDAVFEIVGVADGVDDEDGTKQLALDVDPTPAVVCPPGQSVHDAAPVALEKEPTGHGAHAVEPVTFAKLPTAQSAQAVTGNVYKLDAVPKPHGEHAPLFDCPGLHGQLTAVAHVSVEGPLKSCIDVGSAGQFHTSLNHAVGLVHCPAR
jgi:hypothetical protein